MNCSRPLIKKWNWHSNWNSGRFVSSFVILIFFQIDQVCSYQFVFYPTRRLICTNCWKSKWSVNWKIANEKVVINHKQWSHQHQKPATHTFGCGYFNDEMKTFRGYTHTLTHSNNIRITHPLRYEEGEKMCRRQRKKQQPTITTTTNDLLWATLLSSILTDFVYYYYYFPFVRFV